MMKKVTLAPFFVLTLSLAAQQDCFLGVGSNSDDKIIEVFKLTETQIEKMKNWGAELQYRNSLLEDQAKRLLGRHAQSSPEDLTKMSYEYKHLMDSMQQNMRMIDQRMLSLFDDRQYKLYMKLCEEVIRTPIFVNRQVNEN
ncbi:hypothetical protein [Allomuricauda sp. SCSIO 65647]|uniref:hypothetical protein n=1 Tax=Allomuricauda sp. SCSIO 65647 TaxID=2908843 RepID=UPI001F277DFA|nr:hypothetical protein [Muricauda sp. SCSIO 65647]UJH66807.1 hypothetical protein L0P89_12665 [Muricauda sp. SCSIO 65647]